MDKVIWFTDTFGIKTNGDFFQRVRIEDGKSVTCVTDTFGGMHFTERGRVVILLDYRTAIWYAYDTVKDEELATGIGFCAYNDVVGLMPDLLGICSSGLGVVLSYSVSLRFCIPMSLFITVSIFKEENHEESCIRK